MSPYSYITFLAARQAIAARCLDIGEVFFTDAEIKLYLTESIRTFNALTGFWIADYNFDVTSSSPNWMELADSSTGTSPRRYSLFDTDLYSIILYHIMEPQLAGGLWQGTAQFTVNDLTQAYERRENEIIQFTATNVDPLALINILPNTRTIVLADNILDVRRVRYVPVSSPPLPQVLWRGDTFTFQSFAPAYRQTTQNPRLYVTSDRPPLTLDVDFAPIVSGSLDLLATEAALPAALPASTPLSIPNDWSWVLKWGMLADLLNKQSEAQDAPRAQYCLNRYTEGLTLMQMCPWVMNAEFNNVPVGISSVTERDTYDPYWESRSTPVPRNGLVIGGIDLISVCPRPTGSQVIGLNLELVENAPVPVLDGDFVQVPRDVLDAIVDYSVHLAMLKVGGQEFTDTIPLFDSFRSVCASYSKRIQNLGKYHDIMTVQGKRQEELEPRYA